MFEKSALRRLQKISILMSWADPSLVDCMILIWAPLKKPSRTSSLSLSLSLSHMLNLLTLEYNEPFVVVVVVKLGPFSIGFFIVLTKLVNKNRWRGEVVVLTS